MTHDPPYIVVSKNEAIYRRAQRDLRYVKSVYETYSASRDRQRHALVKKLEKTSASTAKGPQDTQRNVYLNAQLLAMDKEDEEQADPERLKNYPRDPTCQRPAYKRLAYEMAITKAEERLAKARSDYEQAIAEAEVDRAMSEGSDTASEANPSPPSSSRSGATPIMMRFDSRLGQLMSSKGLERDFSTRSDSAGRQAPAPPSSGRGKWLAGWGMHGVAASTFQFKTSRVTPETAEPPPEA